LSHVDSEITDTATQAVLYGASTILQVIIQVATMMIISRGLGPANYGLYTLALLPSTVLSIVSDPGITSSMLRYISIARANGDECLLAKVYRFSLLALSLVNALLLAVIALYPEELGAQVTGREGLRELVLATAPYPLATVIYGAVLTYYAGVEKAVMRSILQVSAPLLRLVLVSIALLLGLSVRGVVVAHVVTYVVIAAIGVFTSLRGARGVKECRLDLRGFTLLAFSLYLIGLAGAIVSRVIGVLVAQVTSSLGERGNLLVGNYNASAAFLGAVSSVLGSLATPLIPLLAKKLGNDNAFNEASITVLNVFLAISMPIALFALFFADGIIYSVYGRSYTYAPLFFSSISISLLAWPYQTVYGSIYWIRDDKKPLVFYSIAILTTGLALSVALSSTMGLEGIALAQGLYPLVSTGILVYYGYYKYGLKPSLGKTMMLLASSLVAVCVARLATQYIQLYIIQVTIGFLLYTLLFTLVSGLLGAIGEIELTLLDSLSRRIPVLGIVIKMLTALYRKTWSLSRRIHAS